MREPQPRLRRSVQSQLHRARHRWRAHFRTTEFPHFSTIRYSASTIDCYYYSATVSAAFLEAPLIRHRTQPPWDFLLTASRSSLQSYELSRLSHAANLRKEIAQLLDSWVEENSAAMLARWLIEHRERFVTAEEPDTAPQPCVSNGRCASDNVFADYEASSQETRSRW